MAWLAFSSVLMIPRGACEAMASTILPVIAGLREPTAQRTGMARPRRAAAEYGSRSVARTSRTLCPVWATRNSRIGGGI